MTTHSNKVGFDTDPRTFALNVFEEYGMTALEVGALLLKAMSHDDIRETLDINELSPRFVQEDEE